MERFPEHYAESLFLIVLILFYAIVNILALCKNSVLRHEWNLFTDLHNERLFNPEGLRFRWLMPFLYAQYSIFFGLTLYTVITPQAAQSLQISAGFNIEMMVLLAISIAIPLIWYFLHYFLYHWILYILGGDGRVLFLNRNYRSMHLLAGPIVMLLFTAVVTAEIPVFLTAILLSSIFIITQITFFYNGFKIFMGGFVAFCIIFVYLCALEIAPLAVIYAKFAFEK